MNLTKIAEDREEKQIDRLLRQAQHDPAFIEAFRGQFKGTVSLEQIIMKKYPNQVRGVAFSPDGKYVAAGCVDGFLRIYDFHRKKLTGEVKKGIKRGVHSIAFSADGKYIAIGSGEGALSIFGFDKKNLTKILEKKGNRMIEALAFHPSGEYLAVEFPYEIHFFNFDGSDLTYSFKIKNRDHPSIHGLDFSPDGRYLAVADMGSVKVLRFDMVNFPEVAKKNETKKSFWGLAFNPDGKHLAVSYFDGDIKILKFNRNALYEVGTINPEPSVTVFDVSFSADGKYLAAGDDYWHFRIFEVKQK